MRLAWLTDIHLNFLSTLQIAAFCKTLLEVKPTAIAISGDIAEADSIECYLMHLEKRLARPIYFVLGNHDYYRGSIDQVRSRIARVAYTSAHLHWLPATGIMPLTESTCILGHDGWADARLGNYRRSPVLLNDYRLIKELSGLNKADRCKMLLQLGVEAAWYLRSLLPEALDRFERVIVVTHVPPFREACWHEGKISNDDWLPHFSCKTVGDVLIGAMQARPDRKMVVLCGHTHSPGRVQILPNLEVFTGASEYGAPQIQSVLNII